MEVSRESAKTIGFYAIIPTVRGTQSLRIGHLSHTFGTSLDKVEPQATGAFSFG
jgi:hypothetical protein